MFSSVNINGIGIVIVNKISPILALYKYNNFYATDFFVIIIFRTNILTAHSNAN